MKEGVDSSADSSSGVISRPMSSRVASMFTLGCKRAHWPKRFPVLVILQFDKVILQEQLLKLFQINQLNPRIPALVR